MCHGLAPDDRPLFRLGRSLALPGGRERLVREFTPRIGARPPDLLKTVCHGERGAISMPLSGRGGRPSVGAEQPEVFGSDGASRSRLRGDRVPWTARSDVRASRPAGHQTRNSQLATRNSIAAREYARPPVFLWLPTTDHRRPTSVSARAPRLEQQRPVSMKETGHRTRSETRITSSCGRPPERLPPWECIRVPARVRKAWGR